VRQSQKDLAQIQAFLRSGFEGGSLANVRQEEELQNQITMGVVDAMVQGALGFASIGFLARIGVSGTRGFKIASQALRTGKVPEGPAMIARNILAGSKETAAMNGFSKWLNHAANGEMREFSRVMPTLTRREQILMLRELDTNPYLTITQLQRMYAAHTIRAAHPVESIFQGFKSQPFKEAFMARNVGVKGGSQSLTTRAFVNKNTGELMHIGGSRLPAHLSANPDVIPVVFRQNAAGQLIGVEAETAGALSRTASDNIGEAMTKYNRAYPRVVPKSRRAGTARFSSARSTEIIESEQGVGWIQATTDNGRYRGKSWTVTEVKGGTVTIKHGDTTVGLNESQFNSIFTIARNQNKPLLMARQGEGWIHVRYTGPRRPEFKGVKLRVDRITAGRVEVSYVRLGETRKKDSIPIVLFNRYNVEVIH
jgi:hypothetical protein